MSRCLIIPLLILISAGAGNGQVPSSSSVQTATTRDGHVVVLKSDGTWQYSKEPPTQKKPAEAAEKRTLLEVQTDQMMFVEKPIIITGTLKMSSDYWAGYRKSQNTHYAFLLSDKSQSLGAFVYMQRGEEAAKLRKLLLERNGTIEGSFTIVILKERNENLSGLLIAELTNYSVRPVLYPEYQPPGSPNSAARVGSSTPNSNESKTNLRSEEARVQPNQQSKTAPNTKTEDNEQLEFMQSAIAGGPGKWISIWGSQKNYMQYYGSNIKRRSGDLYAWWRVEIADPIMNNGAKEMLSYRQVNCEFERSRDLITTYVFADGRKPQDELTVDSDWRHPTQGELRTCIPHRCL